MINSIIETENATRYHAIYISQLFLSDKDFIPSSKITKIIKKHVGELLKQQEWINVTETLTKELSSQSRTSESGKLNEYLSYYKDSSKINSWTKWDDLIGIYCLISIVSQLCSEYDCKSIYVSKCIDLSIEKHIINWIIKHGGWEAYEKNYTNNFDIEKKEEPSFLQNHKKTLIYTTSSLLGIGACIGLFSFFSKK